MASSLSDPAILALLAASNNKVVILSCAWPPDNIAEWNASVDRVLNSHDAAHFTAPDFCMPATMMHTVDSSKVKPEERAALSKLDQLQLKRDEVARIHYQEAIRVKHEGEAQMPADRVRLPDPTYVCPDPISSLKSRSFVVFLDPLVDPPTVEDAMTRILRNKMWAMVVPSLANHPSILNGLKPGDFYGLITAVTALKPAEDDSKRGLAITSAISDLEKTTSVTWSVHSAKIFKIRAAIDAQMLRDDPMVPYYTTMLPPAVLQGMLKDKRYIVELGFIKRDATIDKSDITAVMAALTRSASEIEPVTQTQVGIKGMTASVGDKHDALAKSKRPCFKWRDHAKCDREDCPFTHKEEDKGKGKDRDKDKVPSARGGDETKPRRGGGRECAGCKSTSHGVTKCPRFLEFLASQTPAPTKVPVSAHVAQVAPGGPCPDSPVRGDVATILDELPVVAPAYVNDINMGPFNVDQAFTQVFGSFPPAEG